MSNSVVNPALRVFFGVLLWPLPLGMWIKFSLVEYKMKFEIENQWLLIAKKNRKVAASFWLFPLSTPPLPNSLRAHECNFDYVRDSPRRRHNENFLLKQHYAIYRRFTTLFLPSRQKCVKLS